MTSATLADYRASRDPGTETSVLCHAPFLSLNFEQSGRVSSCCYNRKFELGRYPEQSVSEIWSGADARRLREAFLTGQEAPGCELCFHQVASRNFAGTLMRNFDRYSDAPGYQPAQDVDAPRILEFEIANTCNLECVMCEGHWSSSIRAHREHLPPLRSPYDRAFVDQLESFLPGLAGAKFLGGEPFLIKRYYEIWERIRSKSPDVLLSITTNATILPDRARALLEDLRAEVAVSLDALTPAVYERIRKNARFSEVMTNVEYLVAYTRRRGTIFSLTVCPMRWNWRELPALLEFCEQRSLAIHFNTVLRPSEASLASLPVARLQEVVHRLEATRPRAEGPYAASNRQQWEGMLTQLRGWLEEKRGLEKGGSALAEQVRGFVDRHPRVTGEWQDTFQRTLEAITFAFGAERERARLRTDWVRLALVQCGVALDPAPSPAELLTVTHLIARSIDGAEAGEDDLLAEQRRIQAFVDALDAPGNALDAPGETLDAPGEARFSDELGRWMLERIEAGEVALLVHWSRVLLDALDRPLAWRRDFDAGLTLLREKGLDADGQKQVTSLLEALRTRFPVRSPVHRKAAAAGDSCWSDDARSLVAETILLCWMLASELHLAGVGDLERLAETLEGLHLFHGCHEPDGDPHAFRQRLDLCLAVVRASEHAAEALEALAGADLDHVYKLLAHAPDDEMGENLATLQ